MKNGHLKVNLVDIDPGEYPIEDSLTNIKDIKKIQVRIQAPQAPQTTQIVFNLSLEKEFMIIMILRDNIDMFAWKPVNVPGINPNKVSHHVALDLGVSPWLFYQWGSGIQGLFPVAT